MTEVTPFLMFEGKAEAAMKFYVATIPDSRLVAIERYGPDGPGPEGSVVRAELMLAGRQIYCSDSYVKHAFSFTPSTSLFVTCADEAEFERISGALADGGEWLMPPDDYGFSARFGWLNDRYCVSWQINLN